MSEFFFLLFILLFLILVFLDISKHLLLPLWVISVDQTLHLGNVCSPDVPFFQKFSVIEKVETGQSLYVMFIKSLFIFISIAYSKTGFLSFPVVLGNHEVEIIFDAGAWG